MYSENLVDGKTEKRQESQTFLRLQSLPNPSYKGRLIPVLFLFMIITIHNKQKDLPLSTPQAKKILLLLLKELHISTNEIIVHFVTKNKIAQIHGDFFADPTPTDCMSFPIDSHTKKLSPTDHYILGEVFVCPAIAIEYAKKKQLDPYQETALYMIHGFLHLIGYDDLEPIARRKMRSMEKKCLALIQPFSLQSPKKKIVLKSSITV